MIGRALAVLLAPLGAVVALLALVHLALVALAGLVAAMGRLVAHLVLGVETGWKPAVGVVTLLLIGVVVLNAWAREDDQGELLRGLLGRDSKRRAR